MTQDTPMVRHFQLKFLTFQQQKSVVQTPFKFNIYVDFCTLWISWKPFFICGFFSHPSDAPWGVFNPNVLWPLSTVAKQARRLVGRNHVLCVYADSSQEFTLWQTVELPVVWDMITFTWHNCNKLWTCGWFSNAYEITTIWLSHTDEFLSHPYATTTACLHSQTTPSAPSHPLRHPRTGVDPTHLCLLAD